jgi:hypothetical protein
MSWFFLALIIPLLVAFVDGSTYSFGFSVTGAGIVLYFLNIFLVRAYIGQRAPDTLENDTWESTAGTGIVPRWVSVLGLFGMGLIPAGIILVLLLFLKIITNRAL